VLLIAAPITSIAQDDAAAQGTGTTWTCPEGFEGQQLSIFNWATYIGDFTVAEFEALCGVTVRYEVYDSDEAMIARLQQGNPGYDVAFPTDYAVSIMRRQGLLAEIDLANIPNFKNIMPAVTNQTFDPENKHSIPYFLGTTGIGYRVDAFPNGITSWTQLFEHDGRVAWLENPRGMLGTALLILGYDPNSADEAQINEARDYLIEHGDNVVRIAQDDGESLLVQGEVDAVIEYGGDVFQQIVDCECEDFSFSNPDDGTILDITSVVLLANGPNPALAQVFMDFLADPHIAAHNTNQVGYATPNQTAIDMDLIDPIINESPALTLSEEAEKNAWFIKDIGDADFFYTLAWDEVKILIGQ
jgi:spermidine/putrescine transport system substrate-binding protein